VWRWNKGAQFFPPNIPNKREDFLLEMRVAEANYYRALGAGFGVEVKHIDERQGKGCFAVSSFEDRAVVFRDCSLACLQSRKQTALHEGTLPLSLTAYHRPPFNLCPPRQKQQAAVRSIADLWRPVNTVIGAPPLLLLLLAYRLLAGRGDR
jgi:hypothetical protein